MAPAIKFVLTAVWQHKTVVELKQWSSATYIRAARPPCRNSLWHVRRLLCRNSVFV